MTDSGDRTSLDPGPNPLGIVRAWYREPAVTSAPGPNRVDALIVLIGWTGALVETIIREDVTWRPVAFAVAVAVIAVLPWRRTHPLAVAAVAFVPGTVFTLLSAGATEPFGLYAMVVVLLVPYALLRWGSGRDAAIGLGLWVLTWAASVIADATPIGEAIGGFVVLTLPAAAGALVRMRVTVQEERERRARSSEREQLARELHDTVAHHMSAVAVQAQAGRALAATRPEAATEALTVIEEAASRSLVELRTMVRALRSEDGGDRTPLTPHAGLRDIESLADLDRPGLAISVRIDGPRHAVPESVAGAMHRIAQESVTNVVRHARDARHVDVLVQIEAPHGGNGDGIVGPRVILSIENDGRHVDAHRAGDEGFGLIGMRERSMLLGGSLDAGPRTSGGWSVRCTLPLGDER